MTSVGLVRLQMFFKFKASWAGHHQIAIQAPLDRQNFYANEVSDTMSEGKRKSRSNYIPSLNFVFIRRQWNVRGARSKKSFIKIFMLTRTCWCPLLFSIFRRREMGPSEQTTMKWKRVRKFCSRRRVALPLCKVLIMPHCVKLIKN